MKISKIPSKNTIIESQLSQFMQQVETDLCETNRELAQKYSIMLSEIKFILTNADSIELWHVEVASRKPNGDAYYRLRSPRTNRRGFYLGKRSKVVSYLQNHSEIIVLNRREFIENPEKWN